MIIGNLKETHYSHSFIGVSSSSQIIKETLTHIHFKETSSSGDEDGLYC
ncbi:hypothetical protein CNEO2_370011 [Clostridium neonatale]|uniref:Uncharacterized protein n=1 Tax=Clostridium neonatale TaxID=137838 RepID=A0AAD1YJP6_9CLOT|nr:hypothetical protein CNEO2_240009 [Clostridium neonatale]CAI3206349.1 hypothetical protein CNEO2_370010 [Clostridium neonatale]CAI3549668.1 hypothetical protein CNEO4_1070004 [Clostridium neonatale]CAI3570810.1 hypothetical protein CNEO3_380010 [Clostridium neonatale]CAI3579992.1 hypothetical protein CNEO4_1260001 [Clostridium neonatale]